MTEGRTYLRRLVDRGLGRADVLQPLRPSRFEPALPGAITPVASLFNDVEPAAGVPAPAHGERARRIPDPGEHTGPVAPRPAAPPPSPAAATRAAAPAPGNQPSPVEVPAPRPPRGATRDDRSAPAESSQRSEGDWATRPGRPAAAATGAAQPRPSSVQAPPSPGLAARNAPQSPAARAAIQPPPGLRAPPPLPLPARTSDRRPAARLEHPAERAPAIHVTIGRVEVRTVPALAAPARPVERRAQAAAVPLDEYLRRREQGRP